MPIDRARILANGWSQGSFFFPEDANRLLEEHGERVRARIAQPVPSLILASHACDILSHLDEDEPDVTVYPVLELRAGEQFNPTAVQRPASGTSRSKSMASLLAARSMPGQDFLSRAGNCKSCGHGMPPRYCHAISESFRIG